MNDTHTSALRTALQPATQDRAYILLVDDEPYNRDVLRGPLEAQGHEVLEAASGEEALRLIAQRPPDVIVLDVMMPDLDGFTVCRMLKDDPATASIPVLMVTALSDRKERLMGVGAGANDFLTKPIDVVDTLLRVGNAAFTRRLFLQLKREQERSRLLLHSILPAPVIARMLKGEMTIADHFPEATVLVADLIGFTSLAAQVSASQMVYLLNEIFSTFDVLVERHRLEKIKNLGDAYMVVGGVPESREDHAGAISALALDMVREVARFNRHYSTSFRIRAGICTGPVVAGVIGQGKFAYDVWGETVNLAFQLARRGQANQVHLTDSTRARLSDRFFLTAEEPLELKGGGSTTTYCLGGVMDAVAA